MTTPRTPLNIRDAVAAVRGEKERSVPAHYRHAPPPRCGFCCRNDYDCTCTGGK